MQSTHDTTRPTALLVSIRTPKVTDAEAADSLTELHRLVTTLGYDVISTQSQRLPTTSGITVVGAGKLRELARFTGGKGFVERGTNNTDDAEEDLSPSTEEEIPPELATVVVFDCDLSPSQLRSL
jgi:GTP-binding protein HflX